MAKRVILFHLFTLSTFHLYAQGIPFIRNFTAEEYHANKLNYDVETDENGNVFVANFEGLMYYDHANWRIIHTPGISRVTVTVRTSDNTIWVGGYNYFGKIVRKDNGALDLKRVGRPDLFNGEVNEIFERDGHVRFIVNNGKIYQVEGDSISVWKVIDSQSLRIGVLDVVDVDAAERGETNLVKDDIVLEEPLDGGMTAAIKKGIGVIIRDKDGKDLYTITDANGLCSSDVVYATYDQRGQLWGATAKGVFAIQVPSPLTRFTAHEGLTGNVLSIESMGGKIYAGTDDGLFYQEGMRFVKVPGIRHTCQDMKHYGQDLMAATADGIFRLSPGGGVKQLTSTTSVSILVEDDRIYSGELDGVYLYNINGQGRRKVCNLENVTKIVKDNVGTIWLQSIYGLIWSKKAKDQNFVLYRTGHMAETMSTVVLTDGKVEVICAETTKPFPYPLYSTVDSKGVTWLTNSDGKSVYRWKNGKRLTDLDLLLFPIHEMAVRAIYTQGDEIWLGNENGLVIIDTNTKDVARRTKPKMLIHTVTLGSDSILWGGFGEMPAMLAELDHDQNELHFTYSLDQTPIEGHTYYRYRLNNGSWSAWSSSTSANFVNLTHGYYTFSVQARDLTNRLSDVTDIRFIITPPFYLRWYMNVVYVLLLLALFYLLFRLRLRKLRKDKVRLERLVKDRTDEVVRLEKMATAGKLTQGLIDRILNPLNYINNFAKLSEGLVKDVKANVEDEKEHMSEDNYEDTLDVLDMLAGNLQKVGEHGQSTSRTLKAMEEMLKDRSGGIVPMDLATVLHQNEKMVEEYFKKEIAEYHIKTTYEYPEHVQMDGNPDQLSKTIMCILSNAVYAVVKKSQKTQYAPEVSLHATQNGKEVTLVVRDNGIGIEETIINKVFDPFFTTKTTGEASGVGLYLSREIIQNHGGDISVKSVKDEYTEFTVNIPLKKA